ncbi:hypothetical protein V5799_027327 [Amblyomma americanum]|uniref:Uncharacterized protein n=1 Tax=Amblyomma americanum TaxID=6943 RepID=A0AAQ4DG13_AMBAM
MALVPTGIAVCRGASVAAVVRCVARWPAADRLKRGGPVLGAVVGELTGQLDAAIVWKAVVTIADSGPTCPRPLPNEFAGAR